MENRKKLRKRFFNGDITLEDLTGDEQRYIFKYIKKMERDIQEGKDASIPTFIEVPCQKTGKNVQVPCTAKIVTGEDGLLYLGEVSEDTLIVSQYWHDQEYLRKNVEGRKNRDEREKLAVNLEPTRLGED